MPARSASTRSPPLMPAHGVAELLRRRRSARPAAILLGLVSRCCPKTTPTPGSHHLLIRRNDATGELAYLAATARARCRCARSCAVAGQRWRIEESFQAAKGLVGLDQHQVRRWTSWHRWTTLAMLAHAFLALATAIERVTAPTPDRLDRVDRQRVPPTLRRASTRPPTTPSTPSWPGHDGDDDINPAPALSHYRRHLQPMITIYGCSTSAAHIGRTYWPRCISRVTSPRR